MTLMRGNGIIRREGCHTDTLTATNPTRTGLGWTLGLHGQIPATIRLSLDSLCFCIVALIGHKETTYKNGGDLMWVRTSVLEAFLSAVPFCLLSTISVTIHTLTYTDTEKHTYIHSYIHTHKRTSYIHA